MDTTVGMVVQDSDVFGTTGGGSCGGVLGAVNPGDDRISSSSGRNLGQINPVSNTVKTGLPSFSTAQELYDKENVAPRTGTATGNKSGGDGDFERDCELERLLATYTKVSPEPKKRGGNSPGSKPAVAVKVESDDGYLHEPYNPIPEGEDEKLLFHDVESIERIDSEVQMLPRDSFSYSTVDFTSCKQSSQASAKSKKSDESGPSPAKRANLNSPDTIRSVHFAPGVDKAEALYSRLFRDLGRVKNVNQPVWDFGEPVFPGCSKTSPPKAEKPSGGSATSGNTRCPKSKANLSNFGSSGGLSRNVGFVKPRSCQPSVDGRAKSQSKKKSGEQEFFDENVLNGLRNLKDLPSPPRSYFDGRESDEFDEEDPGDGIDIEEEVLSGDYAHFEDPGPDAEGEILVEDAVIQDEIDGENVGGLGRAPDFLGGDLEEGEMVPDNPGGQGAAGDRERGPIAEAAEDEDGVGVEEEFLPYKKKEQLGRSKLFPNLILRTVKRLKLYFLYFFVIFFSVTKFVEGRLWKMKVPTGMESPEKDRFEAMEAYRGQTFDQLFKNGKDYAIAHHIFCLYLMAAKVLCFFFRNH